MMRSMVAGALLVCTVANTRTPKLASWSASFMVSLLRSSPTRMTCGSSRAALRMALAKVEASGPTSRWVTCARNGSWTNSTGSSMVRMWQARLGVDVVNHRRERRRLARAGGPRHQDEPVSPFGQGPDGLGAPELGERRHFVGDEAEDRAEAREPVEVVGAKARPRVRVGEVEVELFGDLLLLLGVDDLEEQSLHLVRPTAHLRGGA